MKIKTSQRERGMVASVVVLIFIGVIFSIVVARGRQVTNLKKSLVLTEKRQAAAMKQWTAGDSSSSK